MMVVETVDGDGNETALVTKRKQKSTSSIGASLTMDKEESNNKMSDNYVIIKHILTYTLISEQSKFKQYLLNRQTLLCGVKVKSSSFFSDRCMCSSIRASLLYLPMGSFD